MTVPTRRWRAAFWSYAVIVAILTHWPGLALDVPEIRRPDLIIHGLVFGAWTALLGLSGYMGRLGGWMALALTCLVAAGYAAIDEWTQQFVRRHTAMDDFLANLVGVAAGALVLGGLSIRANRAAAVSAPPSSR